MHYFSRVNLNSSRRPSQLSSSLRWQVWSRDLITISPMLLIMFDAHLCDVQQNRHHSRQTHTHRSYSLNRHTHTHLYIFACFKYTHMCILLSLHSFKCVQHFYCLLFLVACKVQALLVSLFVTAIKGNIKRRSFYSPFH